MKKLIIGCDLDDVLNDQCRVWVDVLNFTHALEVKYEDLNEWDMSKNFPGLSDEHIYGPSNGVGLVNLMKPTKDAVHYTSDWISRGHTIIIITSTSIENLDAKSAWLNKHYPWYNSDNLILTRKKQLIKSDILIDDGVHNMLPDEETGVHPVYTKLCFDRPWNRSFNCEMNGITRVHSFSEIDVIIKKLEAVH